MRILSAIFGFIVLIFIVWFTVSNQQPLTLSLAKVDRALEFVSINDVASDNLSLPAYIWGFIIFAVGFASGVVATIVSGGKARSKKRALKRDLRSTKKELSVKAKEIERIKDADENLVDPVALIQKS